MQALDLGNLDMERLAPMLGWACGELSACFGNIAVACQAHMDGRDLPPSLYRQAPARLAPAAPAPPKARRVTKPKDPNKPKRKPTAFNIFVKRKMESLKEAGLHDPEDPSGQSMALSISLSCYAQSL